MSAKLDASMIKNVSMTTARAATPIVTAAPIQKTERRPFDVTEAEIAIEAKSIDNAIIAARDDQVGSAVTAHTATAIAAVATSIRRIEN